MYHAGRPVHLAPVDVEQIHGPLRSIYGRWLAMRVAGSRTGASA